MFKTSVVVMLTVSAFCYDGVDLVQTKVSPNTTAEIVRDIVDAAIDEIRQGADASSVVTQAAHAAAGAIKQIDAISDVPADIVVDEEISAATGVISQLMTRFQSDQWPSKPETPGRCCYHQCGGNGYCASRSDWCGSGGPERCTSWSCNGKWCTDEVDRDIGRCTGHYICVGADYEGCTRWRDQGCVWSTTPIPQRPRPAPLPIPTPRQTPPRQTPRPTPRRAATATPAPTRCECTGNLGKGAQQSYYPEDMGEYCKAWDWEMDYCQEGGAAAGESWCPSPWCYTASTCPGAMPGTYFNDSEGPRLFYSHEACGAIDTYSNKATSWKEQFDKVLEELEEVRGDLAAEKEKSSQLESELAGANEPADN